MCLLKFAYIIRILYFCHCVMNYLLQIYALIIYYIFAVIINLLSFTLSPLITPKIFPISHSIGPLLPPGGKSRHRKPSVYSAHVTYAGYCPASRQDSERASLSSGRTDSDAVSLSGSSV